MTEAGKPRYVIAGGGLAGALAAVYLAKAGYEVDLHEMRGDLREAGVAAGKSINLALSYRGICALERVGLAQAVLAESVAMPGRMMHAVDGTLTYHPYGVEEGQAIHSVSRGGLNIILLDAAEKFDSVRLHFHSKCTDFDADTGAIEFTDTRTNETTRVEGAAVIGADGAFSAVRRRMQRLNRFAYRQDYLAHGYKELTIPPGPGGSFAMEKHALHIWPRRSLMMIALPNFDGSYTCTLFWPFEGAGSFEATQTPEALRRYFETQFPDALPLMPTLNEEYFENPTGSLVTVRCAPWYHRDKVVLVGDACHAVVPFYGQGMNAAFEDVLVLSECLEKFPDDRERAFAAYHSLRKENVDALADLALANFVEMRDHTGSPAFLRKKKREKRLHKLFPRWYTPLYTMATFTRMPYVEAVARADYQDRVVQNVGRTLLTLLAIIILILLWGVV